MGANTSTLAPEERQRLMVDTQDACLAMSVISWDPEGRNMLLRDNRTVAALVDVLGQLEGQFPDGPIGDNAYSALNIPAQVFFTQRARMTIS